MEIYVFVNKKQKGIMYHGNKNSKMTIKKCNCFILNNYKTFNPKQYQDKFKKTSRNYHD